jgi:transposase
MKPKLGHAKRYLLVRNNLFPLLCLPPLNAELNPICHLLALLGAHHIFHVSGLRVKNQQYLL